MSPRARRRVLGSLLSVMITAGTLCGVSAPASAASALPADGSFVSYHGGVYSVAGRSLLRVVSWAPFGGPRRSKAISKAQFDAAAARPVDGSFVRALPQKRIYEQVDGAWFYVSTWSAFGGPRHYADVDARALDLTAPAEYSAVPTFVRSGQDHRVYTLVDGALVYVSSWVAFGGQKPSITIDGNAVTGAGHAPWANVLRYPRDNTILAAVTAPGQPVADFVVSAGAPVFLTSGDVLPEGVLDPVRVDRRSIDAAGGAFPYDRLRFRPQDGSFLYGAKTFDPTTMTGTGQLYWISGGAPIPVRNANACRSVPGADGGATVNDTAVQRAGTGGVYDHLAAPPSNPATPPC